MTKIKSIADLSYIPFGVVLLFTPVNILIKAILFFSTVPSAIVGLKHSQRNGAWKILYGFLNYFFQPVLRIEFAVMGIVAILPLETAALLWILAINVALLPLFVWILKIWIDAAIRATWEEDGKPSLFRKRAS